MEHNTLFKLIYTLILGVVIALFLGIGVQAFYEAPKQPEYPISTMSYKEPTSADDEKAIKEQQQFEKDMRAYEPIRQDYEKNVSIILLVLAVGTIAVGLLFTRQLGFLSDGVLLGGLFTMLHSIVRGLASNDSKFLFVIVTVAVVAVLYLGYRRFGPALQDKSRKSSKA